jgi:acyl-CoA thioester hydrolase
VPRIFHKTLSVGPESIDAVGHVNNREYLRWMEEIAVEHSTAQGWPMERYFAQRMAWVAISHYIEYLRPALAGEPIDIHTWVASWNLRDSMRRYAVLRERKLLARGETRWAFVDMDSGRARDIPAEVRAAFSVVDEDDHELRALRLSRARLPAAATRQPDW